MESRLENISDDEVIAGLVRGGVEEERAIRHLYRAHFQFLSQYIVSNNGSHDDAQDIFQEVIIAFVHLVKGGKFRGEASIKTFLYSLNRNMWLNELKRKGRADAREEKYEAQFAKAEESIEQALEYQQMGGELMRVLGELGETCKQILVLFYYEDWSIKEILNTLNYENEQVVRNKKHKCLKKMEQLVQSSPAIHKQLKAMLHG